MKSALPSLSLRITTLDDRQAVTELLTASYTTLLSTHYTESELEPALPYITKAHDMLLASGTYYLVEAVGKKAVGCGGWTPERPGTGEIEKGLGHLRHFATHPDYLGQGIGRMIAEHCFDNARQAKIENFEVYATLNGEAFYHALGFERIAPIKVSMGAGLAFPSIHMKRKL